MDQTKTTTTISTCLIIIDEEPEYTMPFVFHSCFLPVSILLRFVTATGIFDSQQQQPSCRNQTDEEFHNPGIHSIPWGFTSPFLL
jgi:hypothetical protein